MDAGVAKLALEAVGNISERDTTRYRGTVVTNEKADCTITGFCVRVEDKLWRITLNTNGFSQCIDDYMRTNDAAGYIIALTLKWNTDIALSTVCGIGA